MREERRESERARVARTRHTREERVFHKSDRPTKKYIREKLVQACGVIAFLRGWFFGCVCVCVLL